MTVYGLVDPIDFSLKYVGMTVGDARKRFEKHVKHSSRRRSRKERWIAELDQRGLLPKLCVLEVVDGSREELAERERFWIRKMKQQGEPLTNTMGVR